RAAISNTLGKCFSTCIVYQDDGASAATHYLEHRSVQPLAIASEYDVVDLIRTVHKNKHRRRLCEITLDQYDVLRAFNGVTINDQLPFTETRMVNSAMGDWRHETLIPQ